MRERAEDHWSREIGAGAIRSSRGRRADAASKRKLEASQTAVREKACHRKAVESRIPSR